MTNEQRIEQLQRELDALKTELQTKEPDPEPEWPKDGDEYHSVDNDGEILTITWCGSNYDRGRLAIGNSFRTEAEARRRKAIWMSAQPCGPEPKVGETVWVIGGGWDFMAHRAYAQSPWFVCAYNEGWLSTSRDELEKRIKRFGWAFRGEPEPEGWDTE